MHAPIQECSVFYVLTLLSHPSSHCTPALQVTRDAQCSWLLRPCRWPCRSSADDVVRHPDDERSRAPMVVWRGQLALQGGPVPFGVEASAAGATAADSDVWTALPIAGSSIETSGRVEVSALKNHLLSLGGKGAKWGLGLACFRCRDPPRGGGPPRQTTAATHLHAGREPRAPPPPPRTPPSLVAE
eukprot:COSAG01_NODE_32568_length_579_cov_0.372917_1_plen_185_part_10